MDSLTKQDIRQFAKAILERNSTAEKRDLVIALSTEIFKDRNALYKDAWREYRIPTFVDRNIVKAKRLRHLEESGQWEEALEQVLDQVNEGLFLAILILEKLGREGKDAPAS